MEPQQLTVALGAFQSLKFDETRVEYAVSRIINHDSKLFANIAGIKGKLIVILASLLSRHQFID